MIKFSTFQLGTSVAQCLIEDGVAQCSIFENSKLKLETKISNPSDLVRKLQRIKNENS
jgi:hypothetical protein